MDYPSKLTIRNIDSFQKRRLHADLIFSYKIIFGLIDMKSSDYFTLNNNNFRDTRALNPYKLHIMYAESTAGNSFSVNELSRFGTVWQENILI